MPTTASTTPSASFILSSWDPSVARDTGGRDRQGEDMPDPTAATADRIITAWEITQRRILAIADGLERVNAAIRHIWAEEASARWADAT